jgi:Spy/CpxP family protein refolding chaperone
MKNVNKNLVWSFLALVLLNFSALAQNENRKNPDEGKMKERREKMQEMKKNYVLKNVELTAAESAKLVEINEKYENLIFQSEKEHREKAKAMHKKNSADISEAEARDFLTKEMEHKEKMHQLKKQKQEELLQNFSAVKVLEIQKAEKKFKHEAMKHHVKNKDKNNR